MFSVLVDLGRIVVIILLLPIILILIGPLLVLAVLRGRQRIGPITLETSKYDFAGRAGILMLGVAIWLLVWSGLAWLAFAATVSPAIVQAPPVDTTIGVSNTPPTLTVTPLPASPTVVTPTATQVTPTPEPTEVPIATATEDASTATPAPASRDLATDARLTATPALELETTLTASTSQADTKPTETLTPTRQPTFTAADRLAAIAAIEEANVLLQEAISLPSEDNLTNLGTMWQDRALTKVEKFAIEQYERYAQPFDASFEFISPPTVDGQISPSQLVVTAQERWSYGRFNADKEAFEFIYTLTWTDGRWIITRYTYRNLPAATATASFNKTLATATPGP